MLKKLLRIIAWIIGVAGLYLIFGIVICEYVFPAKEPDYANYFRPGDKLVSRFEGFDQTLIAVDGEWMHTRLEVLPNAAGAFSRTFHRKLYSKKRHAEHPSQRRKADAAGRRVDLDTADDAAQAFQRNERDRCHRKRRSENSPGKIRLFSVTGIRLNGQLSERAEYAGDTHAAFGLW